MRVPRIPVEVELAEGATLELAGDDAHHLLRVLRLSDGAAVRLFNGAPGDWHGTLAVGPRRRAWVRVERFEARPVEPALQVTLVQGIARGQRMDYMLQKSVELGVSAVVPVVMERTQAAPAGERIAKKARHWRGVIAAAAAQAGRTRMPALAPQTGFRDWLAHADPDDHPHVLLDPDASAGPAGLSAPQRLTLLAGPEGGFAPAERETAYAAGCTGMRLGPRVLRTETAAVAALAALQALHGDLG